MGSVLATTKQPAESADDLVTRGEALQTQGKHAEALPLFQRATQLDPRNVGAWANLGYAFNELKRFDEELSACNQALTIESRNVVALAGKGAALRGLGRCDEAVIACDMALTIDPAYARAWNNKGTALGTLKRHAEALAAYDRALALDPNFATAWYNKGVALSRLGRNQERLEAYERATDLDPNYAMAWSNKARALRALNRVAEADEAERRAKALGGWVAGPYATSWKYETHVSEPPARRQGASSSLRWYRDGILSKDTEMGMAERMEQYVTTDQVPEPERRITRDFPFVNIMHPAHLTYISKLWGNTLDYLLTCLDECDAEKRDHLLTVLYLAIIRPRQRPPVTGQETVGELFIDEISYEAFKQKCRQIATSGPLDHVALTLFIVNFVLQSAFEAGDMTKVEERIERSRQHIEFIQTNDTLLQERGLSKGVQYALTKMYERGVRETAESTRRTYEDYVYFCEHVVQRLLQEQIRGS